MRSKSLSRTSPAFIEPMEPRLMFTIGQLDPAFGTGGIELLPADFIGTTPTIDGSNDRLKISGDAITRLNPDGSIDTTFGSAGTVTLDFAPGTLRPQADGSLYAGNSVGQTIKFAHINANGSLDANFGNAGEDIVTPTLPTPDFPGSSFVLNGTLDFVRRPSGDLVFAIDAEDDALLPSPTGVALIIGTVPANGVGGSSGSTGGALYGPQLQALSNGSVLLYATTVGGQESAPQNILLDSNLAFGPAIGPQGDLFTRNYPPVVDSSGSIFTYTTEEPHPVITRSSETGAPDNAFGNRYVPDVVTAPIGIIPEPDGGLLIAYDHLWDYSNNPTGLAFVRLNADGTPNTSFGHGGPVYASLNHQAITFEQGDSLKLESNGDISITGTDANGLVEARFQGTTGSATNATPSSTVLHPPARGHKYAYVTVTFQQAAAAIDPTTAAPGDIGLTVTLPDGYDTTTAALVSATGGNGQPLVATYVFLMAPRGFSPRYAGTYSITVFADDFFDTLDRGNAGGIAATYLVNFPRRAHGRAVTTLLQT